MRYLRVKFPPVIGFCRNTCVNIIFKDGKYIIFMRIFVALDVDNEIKDRIKETMSRLSGKDFDIKPVEKDNLHFTIKFLGEVDEHRLHGIEKLISESVKDVKPFKISVEGTGYFGTSQQPKVVWVGVKEGRHEMSKLMKIINEKLIHVKRDEHDLSPHLTIARVRTGKNMESLLHVIEEISHVKFGEMDVKLVKLKSCDLTSRGPVYRDITSFPLGEKAQ